MKEQDLYCRIINKLLNQLMKKKYNYDFVFYLHPVQHLLNRELNSDFYSIDEIVSVNIKTSIRMFEYDILTNEIKDCLNLIIPMVEGSEYREINKVKLKIKSPIVSGTLVRTIPTMKQQN
ncbi:hypothetical protein [Flavobacterium sp.]|uniref:hypothetical protein n=1 Tax=Flavobacterium sp. TaxID=239 RepID=UPI0026227BAF|nr:hypothetical protein [Flavobacterium sp.]